MDRLSQGVSAQFFLTPKWVLATSENGERRWINMAVAMRLTWNVNALDPTKGMTHIEFLRGYTFVQETPEQLLGIETAAPLSDEKGGPTDAQAS